MAHNSLNTISGSQQVHRGGIHEEVYSAVTNDQGGDWGREVSRIVLVELIKLCPSQTAGSAGARSKRRVHGDIEEKVRERFIPLSGNVWRPEFPHIVLVPRKCDGGLA